AALHGGEIQLDELDEAREVRHHQDRLVVVAADEREHPVVMRRQHFHSATTECLETAAEGEESLHPPEQRARVVLLCFYVQRLVVVLGVDVHRQDQLLRI